MCVLNGYIGCEPAAPILLEMLEKQEGLGGGYYTGIATVHEGKLHYRKVLGDVATLRSETDAEALPGTLGIGHSRTASGGDAEWAHPFVSCDEKMAYVAQGATGFFSDRRDAKTIGDRLLAKGHRFRATSKDEIGSYPVLTDGRSVHMSDIMCHLIEDEFAGRGELLEAMRQAYMMIPGEICGLTIHKEHAGHIVAATVNQSIVIGQDERSTYLASTGLAFPDSVTWRLPLPCNCAGDVSRRGVHLRSFDATAEPVNQICPYAEAEREIMALLAGKPGQRWGQVAWGAIKPHWPAGVLTRNTPMTYEILERLHRTGRIRFEMERVPGMFNTGTVPQVRMYLQS